MTPGLLPAATPRGPDLRLLPAAAASWAASGWAVAVQPGTAFLAALVALLAAAALTVAAVRYPRRGSAATAVPLACAAAVLLCTGGHLVVRSAGPLPALIGQAATVTVDAVVLADPRQVRADAGKPRASRDQVAVRVRVVSVTGRGRTGNSRAPVLLLGSGEWAGVAVGGTVRAVGRLAAVDPGDDVVALLIATRPPAQVAPPPALQGVAEQLRAGLRAAAEPLPPGAGGLLPGLVVGDTSELPPDLEDDMRAVGLTHLTAVSGANVAILCGAVLLAAAAAGAGRRARLVLAAVALAGFVVLARPEPSVLRAAVMGAIGLLGLATARPGRGMPMLCTAVVLLTGVDPWLSRSFGFALSVLATAALLLLARPLADALGTVMPRLAAQAISVPAAAQAACAPVVVLLEPSVPLLAVPANLLVAPAVAPATVLGVVATVLAPVSMPLAEAVAWLAGVATGWIAAVATTAAAVPGASLPWPEGVPGAVLLGAVTVLALAAGARLLARARAPRRPLTAVAVLAAACALAVLSTAAVRTLGGPRWPPPGWRAVACDVGQGDALVLATGAGSAVVVDTGPDPLPLEACLRALALTRVDLLVLTHYHADHVGGLEAVLAGRPVARAVVSPLPQPQRQAERTARLLERAGLAPEPATAGLGGTAGDLRWRVLWPPPGQVRRADGEEDSSGANDASVVVLFEAPGFRLLATGDIELPAQAALREAVLSGAVGDVAPVDVLKVAHHGSAAQDPQLHRLLAPRVALVSAGAGNDYGHPTQAALDVLTAGGAAVLRTDRDGHLAVGGSAGRLWVAPQRPSEPDGTLGAWQQDAA